MWPKYITYIRLFDFYKFCIEIQVLSVKFGNVANSEFILSLSVGNIRFIFYFKRQMKAVYY